MEYDTSVPLHKEIRSDGWYIVGKGLLIPVNDEAAADSCIQHKPIKTITIYSFMEWVNADIPGSRKRLNKKSKEERENNEDWPINEFVYDEALEQFLKEHDITYFVSNK